MATGPQRCLGTCSGRELTSSGAADAVHVYKIIVAGNNHHLMCHGAVGWEFGQGLVLKNVTPWYSVGGSKMVSLIHVSGSLAGWVEGWTYGSY